MPSKAYALCEDDWGGRNDNNGPSHPRRLVGRRGPPAAGTTRDAAEMRSEARAFQGKSFKLKKKESGWSNGLSFTRGCRLRRRADASSRYTGAKEHRVAEPGSRSCCLWSRSGLMSSWFDEKNASGQSAVREGSGYDRLEKRWTALSGCAGPDGVDRDLKRSARADADAHRRRRRGCDCRGVGGGPWVVLDLHGYDGLCIGSQSYIRRPYSDNLLRGSGRRRARRQRGVARSLDGSLQPARALRRLGRARLRPLSSAAAIASGPWPVTRTIAGTRWTVGRPHHTSIMSW